MLSSNFQKSSRVDKRLIISSIFICLDLIGVANSNFLINGNVVTEAGIRFRLIDKKFDVKYTYYVGYYKR